MELLKLSLKRKTFPVILVDDKDEEKNYVLKDLTGASRDEYLSFLGKKMTINGKGEMVAMNNFDGLASFLLALAMYDDKDKLVPKNIIDNFPAEVQDALFDKAQELSGLDTKAAEKAGNDSEAKH